jgi:hypothetical protein
VLEGTYYIDIVITKPAPTHSHSHSHALSSALPPRAGEGAAYLPGGGDGDGSRGWQVAREGEATGDGEGLWPGMAAACISAAAAPQATALSTGVLPREIALEVDGPTHFVDAEMLPPQAFAADGEAGMGGDGGAEGVVWRGSSCSRSGDHGVGFGGGRGRPGLVLNSATLLKRMLLKKEGYQVSLPPRALLSLSHPSRDARLGWIGFSVL